MFCQHCGKPLRDDAAFCEYCGQRVAEMPPDTLEVPLTPEEREPSASAQSLAAVDISEAAVSEPLAAPESTEAPAVAAKARDVKGFWVKNRVWVVLAACLLIGILVVASVVGAMRKRVDISRFLQASAAGYDGYGSLTVDFDYTSFVERVKGDRSIKAYGDGKKKETADSVNVNSLSSLGQYAVSEAERSAITNAVTIETTLPDGVNRTHLTNGDEVTFTITFDKTVAKRFGVKVKDATCSYTVSGLLAADTFDVMQYFDVAFSGIDGNGRATIKSTPAQVEVGDATFTIEENSSYVSCRFADGARSSISVYFVDSNSGSLHTGDTVRLTTNVDEERFAEKGVVLTGLSKEVRVEKLGKYVTQLSDLNEVVPVLAEKGAEDVRNYIYSDWAQAVHNSWYAHYSDQKMDDESLTLYKMVLTTPKDTSDVNRSRLWCVYTVTVSDNEFAEPTTLYFGVCYRNLTLDEQGRLPENLTYSNRTNGYASFAELLQNKIEAFNLNVEQSE